jgi:hypothetical protein
MTRISCEQQDIAFFRFSPVIGNDVGTTERDNHKLCEIIIRYLIAANHPGRPFYVLTLILLFLLKQD